MAGNSGSWQLATSHPLPPSAEEELSQPKYLLELQSEEPDSGIELVRLEQTRELEQIAEFVSTARKNYRGTNLASRYKAFKSLASEVTAATAAIGAMPMQPQTVEHH